MNSGKVVAGFHTGDARASSVARAGGIFVELIADRDLCLVVGVETDDHRCTIPAYSGF